MLLCYSNEVQNGENRYRSYSSKMNRKITSVVVYLVYLVYLVGFFSMIQKFIDVYISISTNFLTQQPKIRETKNIKE